MTWQLSYLAPIRKGGRNAPAGEVMSRSFATKRSALQAALWLAELRCSPLVLHNRETGEVVTEDAIRSQANRDGTGEG